MHRTTTTSLVAVICALSMLSAQPLRSTAREIADAERDVPTLAEALQLKPGMTVADVGAGTGQMSLVFSKWLGSSGRVFATGIGQRQLEALRAVVADEHLSNMTVIEGAPAATNLPAACCDAIFLQDVYHHIVDVGA